MGEWFYEQSTLLHHGKSIKYDSQLIGKIVFPNMWNILHVYSYYEGYSALKAAIDDGIALLKFKDEGKLKDKNF